MKISVQDGLIDNLELYRDAHWLQRLDVYPFVILYALFFVLIIHPFPNLPYQETKLFGLIGLPIVLAMHLLMFLCAQSSIKFRCFIGKLSAKSIEDASYALALAAKNMGKSRLVDIERLLPVNNKIKHDSSIKVFDRPYALSAITFRFQEITYYYDKEIKQFKRLDYPVELNVEHTLSWQGHDSNETVICGFMRWGKNEFAIPVPHFLDLYMEHLVAPFFVFQVVCLFLWSLDDYWYYSLFTLFMLMVFEGVMCTQRQNNVLMMRSMRRPAFQLCVYRGKKWVGTSSDMLIPGDIISITADPAITVDEQFSRSQKQQSDTEEGKVVPCDILLLRGNCVVNEAMLTGESVPKMKEHVDISESAALDIVAGQAVNIAKSAGWSRHILLGGTQLQQHTVQPEANNQGIPEAPDRGCIGVVIRTGFATTQGELMRKILFATEGVTANTKETFSFIAVLVLFAFTAAIAVLRDGVMDEKRNKFRLVLHCIMIITSVVPPELPMELSLAVTNSLGALGKQMIYCTEPFRIALAGRLNVICFDKTGTLTKDEMILKGIVSAQDIDIFSGAVNAENSEMEVEMIDPETTTPLVQCIMGTCHDLVVKMGPIQEPVALGDPMEMVAFNISSFSYVPITVDGGRRITVALMSQALNVAVNPIQKFPFSSELKRMTTIVEIRSVSTERASEKDIAGYVFSKGAPEVMQQFLATVPKAYAGIYQHHMQSGKRVLCLAYKKLPKGVSPHKLPRAEAETGLTFAGFLVFDSDLKADSKGVVKELHSARQKVVMITGDSVYTAANVGKRLAITSNQKQTLVLTVASSSPAAKEKVLVWRSIEAIDDNTDLKQDDDAPFNIISMGSISAVNNLCVTGTALDELANQSNLSQSYASLLKSLCPHISIFARVSPVQKEKIILAFNDAGFYSLMCGDGTNDVGALKAAHVGVSIINNPKLESKVEDAVNKNALATGKGGKTSTGKSKSSVKDRAARALLELQENESDPSIVKLGDASIASPFTTKRTSVDAVLTVIRQGRCTLVTTIQVYKVLALNCLASAFMMSALYMRGLKQGDMQMTCTGLVTAALFFFLSQAKPLISLSESSPPSSVFASAVSLSIIGQFLTHLSCMYATTLLCEKYANKDDFSLSPDGKFTPNLINSTMFILANQMQINNFWVNYRGAPYMEKLSANVYFCRLLQGVYLAMLIVIGGQFEPLNDFLQLVQLPSRDFQISFLLILLFNAGAAYGVELACRRLE